MKAITIKLASPAVKELADVTNAEINNSTAESVLKWFKDVHQETVPAKYREELDEVIRRGLSVASSLTNAAMRRYVLATATVDHELDARHTMREIKRELDTTRTTLFEDMLGGVEDTSMALADNPIFFDDLVCIISDEIMETTIAALALSFDSDYSKWDGLLVDVHNELYATAQSLKIKAYLSDSDSVLFFGEDKDAYVVTGVQHFPKATHSAKFSRREDNNHSLDEIQNIVKSVQWTDEYIMTVNGQATHDTLREIQDGDIVRLYEVEECKD
tara:strand:+ start:619 stop:1437 length:819 start_codon:yes stop_codon:yes gene_type:complete